MRPFCFDMSVGGLPRLRIYAHGAPCLHRPFYAFIVTYLNTIVNRFYNLFFFAIQMAAILTPVLWTNCRRQLAPHVVANIFNKLLQISSSILLKIERGPIERVNVIKILVNFACVSFTLMPLPLSVPSSHTLHRVHSKNGYSASVHSVHSSKVTKSSPPNFRALKRRKWLFYEGEKFTRPNCHDTPF